MNIPWKSIQSFRKLEQQAKNLNKCEKNVSCVYSYMYLYKNYYYKTLQTDTSFRFICVSVRCDSMGKHASVYCPWFFGSQFRCIVCHSLSHIIGHPQVVKRSRIDWMRLYVCSSHFDPRRLSPVLPEGIPFINLQNKGVFQSAFKQ